MHSQECIMFVLSGLLKYKHLKKNRIFYVYKTFARRSVVRLCAYDRQKSDIYANVGINNLTWKFGHEKRIRMFILQGVPFIVPASKASVT
jgi:hypothetical protein